MSWPVRIATFGSRWTPAQLGASLLGWWDAERTDRVAQSSGLVSSWKDLVAGYDAVQATGSTKPTWAATSFNNRPGITFDGVDDNLRVASQPFPSGASPSEVWGLVNQTVADADATARRVLAYGTSATNNTTRYLVRAQVGGVSVATTTTGTGAATSVAQLLSPSFNGIHVARSIFTSTTINVEMDGTAATPTSAVSATGTDEVRIAAGTNGAGFFQGVMNTLIVTGPLTTQQATQLYAFLKARGGI